MAFGSQDDLGKAAPKGFKIPRIKVKGSYLKWVLIIAGIVIGWFYLTGQGDGLTTVAAVVSSKPEPKPVAATTAKPEMVNATAPNWADKTTSSLVPVE